MTAEEAKEEALYENETRAEKMVSLKNGEITVRMATFLKPTAKDVEEAAAIPRKNPFLSEILPLDQQNWPSKVIFKGWKNPQKKKWKEWVDRLAPKYAPTWTKAGIFDSIISSTFKLWRNKELLLGLSEYWCPETNTFVFQWGEATISLEDVMILGGYSVHGESVISSSQTQEMKEIEENLRKYRTQIGRCRANKVSHGEWINFFMMNETECEHAAFLSLWLSRFVFPSVSVVKSDALPIAVKLSLGIRVALAPAVLASLYKDLRKLSEDAMASSQKIDVLAPFQLLQVWAFERFPILGSDCPNSIQPGEPRMARWHKVHLKLNMTIVRSSFEFVKNFQWRPYVANVKNWKHPSYIQETDQLVSDITSVNEDDGLLSFLKIVQASELVGVNCRERYSPHRVAMQFGMDQDIPGEWDMLQMNREVVDFYIPPKTFQSGITERYSNWWKDMMVVRKNTMKQLLLNKKYSLIGSHQNNGGTEDCTVRTKITRRRKRKALDLSDDVERRHSKDSTKASTESIFEDSNQPITLSSSEDSDDDHLPISTLLRKSSHHETFAVASQTSNFRKRKLSLSHKEENSQKKLNCHEELMSSKDTDQVLEPLTKPINKNTDNGSSVASKTSNIRETKLSLSHKEENSQKKVNCHEELLSSKETDQVLEPLTKPLDMNTDNGYARGSGEDEIKGTEEYVIERPESEIESRVSSLERIVEGLKALKAAKTLR